MRNILYCYNLNILYMFNCWISTSIFFHLIFVPLDNLYYPVLVLFEQVNLHWQDKCLLHMVTDQDICLLHMVTDQDKCLLHMVTDQDIAFLVLDSRSEMVRNRLHRGHHQKQWELVSSIFRQFGSCRFGFLNIPW